MIDVKIVEAAPRDGFQAVRAFIPTETKIALIEELAACGFSRIEIGSFVSPKAVPQLADTPEIVKRVRLPAQTRIMALVPNARGLRLALEAGVKEISWVISVTEATTAPTSGAAWRRASAISPPPGRAWAGTSRD
jgi:hydroxymethylglutaryl-CoA lyase